MDDHGRDADGQAAIDTIGPFSSERPLVIVTVVKVGCVLVFVVHVVVTMHMRMLAGDRRIVPVRVVFVVVRMRMFMLDRVVVMAVLVPLGDMEKHTKGKQHRHVLSSAQASVAQATATTPRIPKVPLPDESSVNAAPPAAMQTTAIATRTPIGSL